MDKIDGGLMKIEVKDYCKTIKGYNVLDSVNYTFEGGSIYGLFGKNGSGKTMLLRAICGLIKPTKGEICIDDATIGKDIDFPNSVGVIIEQPHFHNFYSGYQNLEILAAIRNNIGEEDIRQVMERVELNPDDKRIVKKYSLGMRQRLAIAQAVMESPDILLFDEPTNALDDTGVTMFQNLMLEQKEKGKIVIIASHNKEDVEALVDYSIVIKEGRIQ